MQILRRPEFGAFVAAVVVYVIFAVASGASGFFSLDGTASWLNVAAELGIVAIPAGLLMISGEIDLSTGSVVGAASMVLAVGTAILGLPIWLCIVLAIVMGAAIGLLNGYLVTRTGLPSFIVTIASNFSVFGAAVGTALLIAHTTTISVVTTPSSTAVFAARVGSANISILWWLAIALAGSWLLARSPFGNWIYATGGNGDVARGAGVPTSLVKIILFVATGAAAALVGVILAIEYHSGSAVNGQGYVFEAPIVAVIGGVLLTGGYGSALGIFLGTIIYGVISVGVFYTGWDANWVSLFLGVLLFIAVLANNYFRKLALRF
jgi:simple sugar transport system permease protein